MFGVEFDSRWRRARDHALAMKTCWAPGPAGYRGEFVEFPEIWSEPSPVQSPHPPVIVASDGGQALELVADFGEGWMAHAARTSPEAVAAGRKEILQRLAANGRSGAGCEVTIFACPPDRERMQAYAQAGAQRIVLYLKEQSAADAESRFFYCPR